MFKSLIMMFTLSMAFCTSAYANLRAPANFYHAPSFSLNAPKAQGLIVEKEKLDMDCDYGYCNVQAVYFIQSNKSQKLAFEFVLPANTPVEANVQGTLCPTTVTKDNSQTWKSQDGFFHGLPLYQAAFSGDVGIGKNTITIKYRQPLTILERSYGYFIHSRSIGQFTYQLAPLKEWTLADDFSLQVTLSAPRKRDDRWSLIRHRAVTCLQHGQVLTKDWKHLKLALTFGKQFPDTLVCEMGDKDLLKSPK